MKKYAQLFYLFLKKHKSKWLLFILLSIVFFLIRFPYKETVRYLLTQAQSKSSVEFQYKSFYIQPLGPWLVFKNPEISGTGKIKSFLKVDQIKLRPSYKSLWQLKPGALIHLKWFPNSLISIQIRKKIIKKNSARWLAHIKARNLPPHKLRTLAPFLAQMKGTLNGDIELLLDPKFTTQPKGFWNISAKKIQSKALSYTFPGAVGTINLPPLEWSKIHSQGKIQEGEFVISDLNLGAEKDAFQLKMRGLVSLDFVKSGFSKKVRPRFKSYHLGLDILVHEDLKPRLYFLDLFFSAAGSQTLKGQRYLAKIKGSTAQFFDMTPVKKRPTLQEIQNPLTE